MYANEPDMAKRWEKHTSSKKLPKRVGEGAEDIPDEEENSHLPDPEEDGEMYQKTTPIHAVQMDEPFEVKTIEGDMRGKEGDWLAKGHNGDMWVIDDEMFHDTHEPAGAVDETTNESEDRELAIKSAGEEWKAIDDYGDRAARAEDPELRDIFLHARDEEQQHRDLIDSWLGQGECDPCEDEPDEAEVKIDVEPPLDVVGRLSDLWKDGHDDVEEISEMSKTCPSCEEGNHARCRDAWCDCCGIGRAEANQVLIPSVMEMFGEEHECQHSSEEQVPAIEIPKMESVFRVQEAPIQNRPPPGSQVMKPTEYTQMGPRGQALKKGMEAMKNSGQEMTPYKTPDGQQIAFPKDAAPGRGPMKADMNTGAWTPMTGSQAGGTGTPFSSQAPTSTMK